MRTSVKKSVRKFLTGALILVMLVSANWATANAISVGTIWSYAINGKWIDVYSPADNGWSYDAVNGVGHIAMYQNNFAYFNNSIAFAWYDKYIKRAFNHFYRIWSYVGSGKDKYNQTVTWEDFFDALKWRVKAGVKYNQEYLMMGVGAWMDAPNDWSKPVKILDGTKFPQLQPQEQVVGWSKFSYNKDSWLITVIPQEHIMNFYHFDFIKGESQRFSYRVETYKTGRQTQPIDWDNIVKIMPASRGAVLFFDNDKDEYIDFILAVSVNGDNPNEYSTSILSLPSSFQPKYVYGMSGSYVLVSATKKKIFFFNSIEFDVPYGIGQIYQYGNNPMFVIFRAANKPNSFYVAMPRPYAEESALWRNDKGCLMDRSEIDKKYSGDRRGALGDYVLTYYTLPVDEIVDIIGIEKMWPYRGDAYGGPTFFIIAKKNGKYSLYVQEDRNIRQRLAGLFCMKDIPEWHIQTFWKIVDLPDPSSPAKLVNFGANWHRMGILTMYPAIVQVYQNNKLYNMYISHYLVAKAGNMFQERPAFIILNNDKERSAFIYTGPKSPWNIPLPSGRHYQSPTLYTTDTNLIYDFQICGRDSDLWKTEFDPAPSKAWHLVADYSGYQVFYVNMYSDTVLDNRGIYTQMLLVDNNNNIYIPAADYSTQLIPNIAMSWTLYDTKYRTPVNPVSTGYMTSSGIGDMYQHCSSYPDGCPEWRKEYFKDNPQNDNGDYCIYFKDIVNSPTASTYISYSPEIVDENYGSAIVGKGCFHYSHNKMPFNKITAKPYFVVNIVKCRPGKCVYDQGDWGIGCKVVGRTCKETGNKLVWDINGCCNYDIDNPLLTQVFQIGKPYVYFTAPFNQPGVGQPWAGNPRLSARKFLTAKQYFGGVYWGDMLDFTPQNSIPYIDPKYNRSMIPIRPFADTLLTMEYPITGIEPHVIYGGIGSGWYYFDKSKTVRIYNTIYTKDKDVIYQVIDFKLGKPISKRTAYITLGNTRKKVTIYEMDTKEADVFVFRYMGCNPKTINGVTVPGPDKDYKWINYPWTGAHVVELLKGKMKFRYPMENVNGRVYFPVRVFEDFFPNSKITWYGDDKVFTFQFYTMQTADEVFRALKQRMSVVTLDNTGKPGAKYKASEIPACSAINALVDLGR